MKSANTHKLSFSVLLPARRAQDSLRLAIESCLNQLGRGPSEVIVIVEESDSNTSAIAIGFVDKRVRLLTVVDGSSLSEKLNEGLANARFGYIARMDADDICLPWRFLRQEALQRSHGVDVIFSTAIVFGAHLRPFPVLPQPMTSLNSSEIEVGLLFGNPAIHPTLFARKTAIAGVGGYRNVPAEDLDLWLRLAIQGYKMARDWVPALLYRYSRNSMSHLPSHRHSVEDSRPLLELRKKLALKVILERQLSISSIEPGPELYKALKPGWKTKLDNFDFSLNH